MDQIEKKDNSQKVELYVSHQNEDGGVISLLNVFRNMGTKKKVFLRLIAIFVIIGLITPMFAAELSQKSSDARAVVKLTYENAEGKTPEEKKPDRLSFSASVSCCTSASARAYTSGFVFIQTPLRFRPCGSFTFCGSAEPYPCRPDELRQTRCRRRTL